jgi:hypothetical protein
METHQKDWDSLEKEEIQSKKISKHMIIIVIIAIVLLFFTGFIYWSIGLFGYVILASIIKAINKGNKNYAKSRYSKDRKRRYLYNYESDEDEQK